MFDYCIWRDYKHIPFTPVTNVQSTKAEIFRTNRTDTDQAYLSLVLREGKKVQSITIH